MNLIAIRNQIKNIQNILQVFNAMKLLSSSKYQVYVKKLNGLKDVYKKMKFYCPDLKELKEQGKGDNIYILVGSDKGLCGSFNSKIKQKMRELPPNSKVVVLGKKLLSYAEEKKHQPIFNLINIDRLDLYHVAYSLAEQLSIMPISSISFLYMKYINGTRQEVVIENILDNTLLEEWKGEQEGDIEEISSYLYLFSKIYQVIMESKTCEFFFRMQAMETSIKNSKDMKNRFQLAYNKQRQANITNEILEIVNGSII